MHYFYIQTMLETISMKIIKTWGKQRWYLVLVNVSHIRPVIILKLIKKELIKKKILRDNSLKIFPMWTLKFEVAHTNKVQKLFFKIVVTCLIFHIQNKYILNN
jgi:hypothetical protein